MGVGGGGSILQCKSEGKGTLWMYRFHQVSAPWVPDLCRGVPGVSPCWSTHQGPDVQFLQPPQHVTLSPSLFAAGGRTLTHSVAVLFVS